MSLPTLGNEVADLGPKSRPHRPIQMVDSDDPKRPTDKLEIRLETQFSSPLNHGQKLEASIPRRTTTHSEDSLCAPTNSAQTSCSGGRTSSETEGKTRSETSISRTVTMKTSPKGSHSSRSGPASAVKYPLALQRPTNQHRLGTLENGPPRANGRQSDRGVASKTAKSAKEDATGSSGSSQTNGFATAQESCIILPLLARGD